MRIRESPPRSFLRGAAPKSSGAKVEAVLVWLSSRLLSLAPSSKQCFNPFFFAALKEVETRSKRGAYPEWSLRNDRVRLDVSSDFDTYMLWLQLQLLISCLVRGTEGGAKTAAHYANASNTLSKWGEICSRRQGGRGGFFCGGARMRCWFWCKIKKPNFIHALILCVCPCWSVSSCGPLK